MMGCAVSIQFIRERVPNCMIIRNEEAILVSEVSHFNDKLILVGRLLRHVLGMFELQLDGQRCLIKDPT